MKLTVPCFVSGREITIIKSDKPAKKYMPRTIIPCVDRSWNTGNDALLIHWKTVRKFTTIEISKRTGFSRKAITDQLKRLGVVTPPKYDYSPVWLVSNDKVLKQLWLEGLKGRELAEHFNTSHRTITSHLKRLGLRKHKR